MSSGLSVNCRFMLTDRVVQELAGANADRNVRYGEILEDRDQ